MFTEILQEKNMGSKESFDNPSLLLTNDIRQYRTVAPNLFLIYLFGWMSLLGPCQLFRFVLNPILRNPRQIPLEGWKQATQSLFFPHL